MSREENEKKRMPPDGGLRLAAIIFKTYLRLENSGFSFAECRELMKAMGHPELGPKEKP